MPPEAATLDRRCQRPTEVQAQEPPEGFTRYRWMHSTEQGPTHRCRGRSSPRGSRSISTIARRATSESESTRANTNRKVDRVPPTVREAADQQKCRTDIGRVG